MILNCAGHDFGCGSGAAIDDYDQRNRYAAIAAHRIVATFGGSPSVVRNDQLVLVQEHVRNRDSFVQQTAGIAAQIQNESIEFRCIQIFQRR